MICLESKFNFSNIKFDIIFHSSSNNWMGVLKLSLDGGCATQALKPLPILRVILTEKGTHLKDFACNMGPLKTTAKICWKFWKHGPMFRDIFEENGTHV